MKWTWINTTRVVFGENSVKDHLCDFVTPNSKVLCTFGGGSIDKNGARKDVSEALAALNCEVKWEGGIPPNPEYDRLMEIVEVARKFQPDFLLAVGGGSIIDGTKFISCAVHLPLDIEPWKIITDFISPPKYVIFGAVLTLPATGSEWNNGFVISRRSINAKLEGVDQHSFPNFSLLDPKYTMTLPERQLKNGVYDAITHCIDQYLTPGFSPMMDNYNMSVFKELVTIGPEVIKPNSSYELHERLMVACSFALNMFFTLGIIQDWSIHQIGHMITALYDIDHGVTLAISTIPFLEMQFENRKEKMAKSAEFIFGITEGTVDEKAHAFLDELAKFIKQIGMPLKISEIEGIKVNEGDVDKLTDMVMDANHNNSFGYLGMTTREIVHGALEKILQ